MNGIVFAWNGNSSHSCSHVNTLFLDPDENPSNVQGIGSEPDNLVITWEVSLDFGSLFVVASVSSIVIENFFKEIISI